MKALRIHLPRLGAGLGPLWFWCLSLTGLAPWTFAAENVAGGATNESPAVLLRSSIQVTGDGVFLDSVVQPGLALPTLRLCDAPAFGKSLVLKRAEICELARAAGYYKPLTNWAGPEAVRISRRARSLGEHELLQLLTTVVQKQYVKEAGQLELRLSRPWTATEVPDEEVALKVLDLPTAGVASTFIVRFELETTSGEHLGPWQAPLQARVWREIWVAGSPLKRGDLLQGADLHRERRDMLLCHEPLAVFAPEDPSLEFFESVQAGSPVYARFLRPRAVVHRGQNLAAMVQDGALMITLKVEALEDGAVGQVIKLRNPMSRRDLHGKVLDEQNVLVSL